MSLPTKNKKTNFLELISKEEKRTNQFPLPSVKKTERVIQVTLLLLVLLIPNQELLILKSQIFMHYKSWQTNIRLQNMKPSIS